MVHGLADSTVTISGNLLASLIDEASSMGSESAMVHQGVLFGTQLVFSSLAGVTDTQEDGNVTDESVVGVTSYLNLKKPHPFYEETPQHITIPAELSGRQRDIVGLISLRNNSTQKVPSMRDVMVARHFLKQVSSSNRTPVLILIINVDLGQSSWIFGMNFTCYGLSVERPQPFLIDLKIRSLSSDSAADYKAAACLHSGGGQIEDMMASVAAASITNIVDLELLSAGMVDEIAASAWAVTVMEAEVAALRLQVRQKRQSEHNQQPDT